MLWSPRHQVADFKIVKATQTFKWILKNYHFLGCKIYITKRIQYVQEAVWAMVIYGLGKWQELVVTRVGWLRLCNFTSNMWMHHKLHLDMGHFVRFFNPCPNKQKMWNANVQNMRWDKVLAYNVKLRIPIQKLALGVIHWFGDV